MINPILENISKLPKDSQKLLLDIRKAILEVIPNAKEVISYGVPAFKDENGKNIIFFSGTKKGCSIYLSPGVLAKFEKELGGFRVHKATLHFDSKNPISITLVKKMVKAKLAEMKISKNSYKK